MTRRIGPRRRIVQIARTGRYGNVEYSHLLECDHVEVRKRASRAPEIACGACVAGQPMPAPLGSLAPTETWDSLMASAEHAGAVAQAAVAKRLGVDLDAVNIHMADGAAGAKIVGATIYLSADELMRIARP